MMELVKLPVELIHHISSFLSVGDVLSLSVTCHHLRNVLNDNSVWKIYLPKEDLSCLEFQEQQVHPLFQPPPSLSPLCLNRLLFMRKVHIFNNWRQGNFKAHILQDACDINFIPDGIRSTTRLREQLLYGDSYLFLCAYSGQFEAIEVWKIEKEPMVHSTLQFELLLDEYFQIVGSHLVLLDCCKVSVYGITIPEKIFPLEYSFLVHQEEIVYGPSGNNLKYDTARLVGWCHCITGQNLVSIQYGQTCFHVWDISEPKKVGLFSIPACEHVSLEPRLNRTKLMVECSAKDDIILRTYLSIDTLYFVGFNLKKKDFCWI